MTPEEYIELASKTCSDEFTPYSCLVGILGESGEIIDMLKKQIWHGKEYTDEAYMLEFGDLLWYTANLARLSYKTDAFTKIAQHYKSDGEYDGYIFMLRQLVYIVNLSSKMAMTDGLFVSDAMLFEITRCIQIISTQIGYTLEEIMEKNIEKLRLRYPNGFELGGGKR